MSNNFTTIVNLGKDPEKLELGGREVYKIRVAEKAGNKKATTRWFTAIVGGPDVNVAQKIVSGDTIVLTGELSRTEYKAKKPRYNGEMISEDEMPFAKILRVIKSPTFFEEKAEGTAGPGETGVSGDAPEGDTPPDLSGLD